MNRIKLGLLIIALLVLPLSCNEPETTVENIIGADGSVTRIINVRSGNRIVLSNLQVPCDSTWTITDSLEIGTKGDTVWTIRAEKYFSSVNEINNTYSADSGFNSGQSRSAGFSKRFRWFHTFYAFTETIDKTLLYGYPDEGFIPEEEARFHYLPDPVREKLLKGPDSLKYKTISDSLSASLDRWIMKSLVSEWIEEFVSQIPGNQTSLSRDSLKAKETEIANMLLSNSEYNKTVKWLLGEEMGAKYEAEEENTIKIIEKRFSGQLDFKTYMVKFRMPGELVSTNGTILESGEILWQPRSEYFLSEKYVMSAESKETNTWAYLVTAIFLLFVISGLIIRIVRK